MFEIREGHLGRAVYATKPIATGEVIFQGRGERIPQRTRHSFQIDVDTHVVVRTPIELMNHSCEPNCGVLVRREAMVLEIHALRTIEEGEELTTDYATFEVEIQFMDGPCLCGSAHCRGRITGYWALPADRRAALGPYIAEYLRELDALVSRAG
jgi:uncharacterized protein